ncbi:MAG: hypothetical protein Q7S20_04475 [Gemmatimonadaceae bacterium]|nr:hypothetical protein [Gemmatimonadaceae bacterium]
MKFSIVAALLVAVSFPASRLAAQGQDQYAWGIAAGATLVSVEARDNHTNGAHGTIMVGIGGVESPFGVRFDGMYSTLGDRKNTTTAKDQGAARVFSLTGNVIFNVWGSDARLYGIAGVGGFGYNPDGPGTTAVNDFGVNAGLGIWIPRVNGFVEARWYNFYRALPDPVTGLKGKKSARLFPISFGLMF